jgi:hypothetical protein
MITGVPKPLQCSLWHWSHDGKSHERCVRLSAVKSEVPGRIPMQTCVVCHQHRMKETA